MIEGGTTDVVRKMDGGRLAFFLTLLSGLFLRLCLHHVYRFFFWRVNGDVLVG